MAVRYLIHSGDGLRNSSTIARLIAPTYFSSSAALMIDSRSKLSLVSFRSSGTSDTSILLTAEPVECTVSNDLHRRKKAARAMPGSTFQTIAIVLYFAGMLTIGYFAYRRTKNNLDGYMLADRGLRPGVAALSAGASDMSGWLLMGLPG